MKKFALVFIAIFAMFTSFDAQSQKIVQKNGFAISVDNQYEEAEMSVAEFKNASFGIHSYKSELANKVKLKGFTVKFPGQRPIKVEGNRLNDSAIAGLEKLNTGDQIVIYDAVAQEGSTAEIRTPMIITIK